MIDEEETFRRFGYRACDLKPGSHKKVWRICELCGKGREIERRFAHRKCKDCDLSNRGGKNHPNWKGGELGKVCAWCGDIYDVKRHEYDRSVCCSKPCQANYYRVFRSGENHPCYGKTCSEGTKEKIRSGMPDMRGENSPRWVPKVEIICEWCGETKLIKPSIVTTTRFCSTECRNKHDSKYKRGKNAARYGKHHTKETREKLSGSNHYNWKGGITPWYKRFAQTIAYKNWRTSVFKRDDYTCQKCMVRGGRLQAHHIRPVRSNKNNLLLFDVNNGITLCKECHREVNGHEEKFESFFDNKIKEVK